MDKRERHIKQLLSGKAARPDEVFKEQLLERLRMKQRQLNLNEEELTMPKKQPKITKSWRYGLATGVLALMVVTIALPIINKPDEQRLQPITGRSSDLIRDDRQIGFGKKFDSLEAVAKGASFTIYAIENPQTNGAPAEITGSLDSETGPITNVTVKYSGGSNGFRYYVSQSNLVYGPYTDDGSREVTIRFDGQTITARFTAPQQYEDGKKSAAHLSWIHNGMTFEITDDSSGISETDIIKLAESLKPFKP